MGANTSATVPFWRNSYTSPGAVDAVQTVILPRPDTVLNERAFDMAPLYGLPADNIWKLDRRDAEPSLTTTEVIYVTIRPVPVNEAPFPPEDDVELGRNLNNNGKRDILARQEYATVPASPATAVVEQLPTATTDWPEFSLMTGAVSTLRFDQKSLISEEEMMHYSPPTPRRVGQNVDFPGEGRPHRRRDGIHGRITLPLTAAVIPAPLDPVLGQPEWHPTVPDNKFHWTQRQEAVEKTKSKRSEAAASEKGLENTTPSACAEQDKPGAEASSLVVLDWANDGQASTAAYVGADEEYSSIPTVYHHVHSIVSSSSSAWNGTATTVTTTMMMPTTLISVSTVSTPITTSVYVSIPLSSTSSSSASSTSTADWSSQGSSSTLSTSYLSPSSSTPTTNASSSAATTPSSASSLAPSAANAGAAISAGGKGGAALALALWCSWLVGEVVDVGGAVLVE